MSCGQSQYGISAEDSWDFSGLWSLAEMIEHFCLGLCRAYGNLESRKAQLALYIKNDSHFRSDELKQQTKDEIRMFIAEYIVQECGRLGFKRTVPAAQYLAGCLKAGHRYSAEIMLHELEGLSKLFLAELDERKFAFVASPRDKYFEQDRLFGDQVYEVFTTARGDIKDAGNCLAASLPTAAVFHLMRVAEHGLRRLAQKLRVKLTDSGKLMPIEFGDWDKVIIGIKNKIAEARKIPAGPKRQAKLEAYSSAADHCEYMKDVWRNNVAHTREPFKEPEAVGVLERVRDFMQFLGKHLS